jgi:hypothetical protein
MDDARAAAPPAAKTLRRGVLRLGGLVLGLASIPQLWMALAAIWDIGRKAAVPAMLDFQTYEWSKYAVLVAPLWLLLADRVSLHHGTAADAFLFRVVFAEVLVILFASVWLLVLGWGFPLW